jgi:hypothetical protein
LEGILRYILKISLIIIIYYNKYSNLYLIKSKE